MVTEPAPAKINLALHVIGRRSDGYHLLDSVVVFAEVGDRVTLESGPASLTVTGRFAAGLEAGEDNLCLRALRRTGVEARITLDKRLPVASGIGGGSADAAAVLRGLARMGHALPDRPERLGADVPVCLEGRPTRMRGTGEILDPVPDLPPLAMVLANPAIPLSTAAVFAALTRADNPGLPPLSAFADAAALTAWLHTCRNDLEAPALALAPQIGTTLAALRGTGAALARMSGSGATCFGLYASSSAAEAAAARIASAEPGWWVTATGLAPAPAGG